MSKKELTVLADRLGVPARRLQPLEEYAADQIAVLDRAVAAAMKAEDDAFATGLQDAVRFIPRPLRGFARKLIFPAGDRD
ncbi:MAG TPA: hypothetical protein VGJ41_05800 [Nocardioides sp.]|jgi:hypothetical protein